MTKGIIVQLENGLDIKKGYSLRKFARNIIGKYTFTFNLLIREEQNEKIAGIIVYANSKVSGRNYIKAIPLGDTNKKYSPLFSDYYDSVDEWDSNMATAYSVALSKILTDFMLKPDLVNKIIENKSL
jgi:hypothetical protein